MDQRQHDELADLFSQSMQLAPQVAALPPNSVEQKVQSYEQKQDEPIHFISSHYTHTGHIRAEVTSEPSHSPPPSYHDSVVPEAVAATLRQHSIDPSALMPSQVELFTNAGYEQRLRLLELWRIAPPSYPEERRHAEITAATSLEREEAEARARYEQQMQARSLRREEHMLDTYIPETYPLEGVYKHHHHQQQQQAEVEPYIVQGYEAVQPPQAFNDPVYAASSGLWQAPNYALAMRKQQQQSAMDGQFGMVEQIRNHADWERLNQQVARQALTGMHGGMDGDDDMVM